MSPAPPRSTLLIVSHTPHHHRGEQLVGWGPTVAEIDHLATLFDRVRHLAPVHDGQAPLAAAPYRADNVEVVPLPPAGGTSAAAKLGVLRRLPGWLRAIRREERRADVTHVRAPANIALVALLVARGPVWVKYAGNWRATGGPLSYRAQRWLARRRRRNVVVTVNGSTPGDPATVRDFANPSLTPIDVESGHRAAMGKQLAQPVQLVFAGRVEAAKGPLRAIEAVAVLVDRGHRARLVVIGEGPQLDACRVAAADLGVDDAMTFTGSLPRHEVLDHLSRAHFVVLPTTASEGWPKVLSEGMAFGAVPMTTSVSAIADVLADIGCGTTTRPDPEAVADGIEGYLDDPSRWAAERDRGVVAAERFTFRTHLGRIRAIVAEIAPDVHLRDGPDPAS